jgi:hypothetical protein
MIQRFFDGSSMAEISPTMAREQSQTQIGESSNEIE